MKATEVAPLSGTSNMIKGGNKRNWKRVPKWRYWRRKENILIQQELRRWWKKNYKFCTREAMWMKFFFQFDRQRPTDCPYLSVLLRRLPLLLFISSVSISPYLIFFLCCYKQDLSIILSEIEAKQIRAGE